MNNPIDILLNFAQKTEKVNAAAHTLLESYRADNLSMLYSTAVGSCIIQCENLAIEAQRLLELTGLPNSEQRVYEAMIIGQGIMVDYCGDSWIVVNMPSLIPSKRYKESHDFLYYPLQAALNEFVQNRPVPKFEETIIVLRHIYDRNRAIDKLRDNDSVEIKIVFDVIKNNLLKDDHPLVCSHYFDSKLGDKHSTKIYILPRSDFRKWWEEYC